MNKDMQFTNITNGMKSKYPCMVLLGTSHFQFFEPIKLQYNKRHLSFLKINSIFLFMNTLSNKSCNILHSKGIQPKTIFWTMILNTSNGHFFISYIKRVKCMIEWPIF
jgi:hypothetical protein